MLGYVAVAKIQDIEFKDSVSYISMNLKLKISLQNTLTNKEQMF